MDPSTNLPKGWTWKKLGEIVKDEKFSIVDGPFGTQLHSSEYTSFGVPVIRIKNITKEDTFNPSDLVYISEEKFETIKRSAVYPQDIILAKTGATIGKVCLLPKFIKKGLIASSCAKISIDPTKVNPKFVMVYLSTNEGQYKILSQSSGSTRNSINLTPLKNIKIPIPPLSTQNQIVEIIEKAENLKNIRKNTNEETDKILQVIFVSMFGDPINNSDGWKIKKWVDVLDIINGRNQKNVEDSNGKYPIYGSGGIMGYANDYLTPENSVIIGRKGSINKPIKVKTKFWNVDTAFGLVPRAELLTCDYLFHFCKIFNFESLNTSTTLPSLTKNNLLQINMPIPPIELQQKFTKIVENVENIIIHQEKSTQEINKLYDALIQKAFNGNL